MKKLLVVKFLLFVFSSISFAQTEITQDEYDVYGVLAHTVILNKTSSENNEKYLRKWLPDWMGEIINDFIAKNEKSFLLEKKITGNFSYSLISQEELDKAFKIDQYGDYEKAWENFYKVYPNSGGYVSFSRVGFNKNKKYALTYVAHSCGGLCGTGKYYLLKKTNNVWKVKKEKMTWIS